MSSGDDEGQKPSAFSSRGGGVLRGRQQAARAIVQRAAGRSGRGRARGARASGPGSPRALRPQPVGGQTQGRPATGTGTGTGTGTDKTPSVFERLSKGALHTGARTTRAEQGPRDPSPGQQLQERRPLQPARPFGSPTGPSAPAAFTSSTQDSQPGGAPSFNASASQARTLPGPQQPQAESSKIMFGQGSEARLHSQQKQGQTPAPVSVGGGFQTASAPEMQLSTSQAAQSAAAPPQVAASSWRQPGGSSLFPQPLGTSPGFGLASQPDGRRAPGPAAFPTGSAGGQQGTHASAAFAFGQPASARPAFGQHAAAPSHSLGQQTRQSHTFSFQSQTPASQPTGFAAVFAAQQAASSQAQPGHSSSPPGNGLSAGASPFFPASLAPSASQPLAAASTTEAAQPRKITFGPQAFPQKQRPTVTAPLTGRGRGAAMAFQPTASADMRPRSPSPEPGDDDEEEAEFDFEAERQRALAATPTFAGASGARSTAQPTKPAAPRPPAPAPVSQEGSDGEDAARKQQRAARFASTLGQQAHQQQAPASQPMLRLRREAAPGGGPRTAGMGGTEDGGAEPEPRFGSTVGTCEAMCPDSEVARRVRMDDFDELEQPLRGDTRTSAELAVKRFARTIEAGAVADFRTQGALLRTQAHLRSILNRKDVPFAHIFSFVWDRFRGMRQDMYVQGMQDMEAMNMYEQHVRFMILGEHELCHDVATATNPEGHNSHLNIEQMNKALVSLQAMYTRMAEQGTPSPNEAEFRAYQLMLAMGTHGKYFYSAASFFASLKRCPPQVLASPLVQQVVALHRALHSGNFVQFFKLQARLPYLPACMCHAYFQNMRTRAIATLQGTGGAAARSRAPDLQRLQQELLLDDAQEALALCRSAGLNAALSPNGSQLQMLPPDAQAEGVHPLNEAVPGRRSNVIAAKAPAVVSDILTSPGGSPSDGAARADTSPFGMSQRVPATGHLPSRSEGVRPTAWMRLSNAQQAQSAAAPASASSAAFQPAVFAQQPAARFGQPVQPGPSATQAFSPWSSMTRPAISETLGPQSLLSTSGFPAFGQQALQSTGISSQPDIMGWGQQSLHLPPGSFSGMDQAQPAFRPPPGLSQPPLSQFMPDGGAQRAAAAAATAAAARQQEQQKQAEQAKADAAQREHEQQEAEARQQQEAARQHRLQLDRRRQEEEAARKRQQEREAAACKAAEEQERRRKQQQQQQQEAEARARAADAARKREEEARRRAAELERQRLEQEALARQAQRERDMLARWQRYQAARALYAWRVTAAEAKHEREVATQQEAALRGCRTGLSPSRSPLAAAFDGLHLTSAQDYATPPRIRGGALVLQSPDAAPSPARSCISRRLAEPLDLVQLLAGILLERNQHADELFWKAAVLTQPHSQVASYIRSMLILPSLSEPARYGGSMRTMQQRKAVAGGRVQTMHAAAVDATSPAAQPHEQQKCTAAAMQGTSAVILLLDRSSLSAEADCASPAHGPSSGSSRLPGSAWIGQQLQALAERLPAELTTPLLVVVCGAAALGAEDEAELRSLLPKAPHGALRLQPWAVFLAQGLEEAGEALSQGVQWLAEHGPAQPELQAIPAGKLARAFLQRRLQQGGITTPEGRVQAHNAALTDVGVAAEAGRIGVGALWHWPPPECAAAERIDGLTADWWQDNTAQALTSALQAASLPEVDPGDTGNTVAWARRARMAFAPASMSELVQAAVHARLGTLSDSRVPAAVVPRALVPSMSLQLVPAQGLNSKEPVESEAVTWPVTLMSPITPRRKRTAVDAGGSEAVELHSTSPAAGRRRLRSPQDEADVFADVTCHAVNTREGPASDTATRLADACTVGENLEALIRLQLAVGGSSL